MRLKPKWNDRVEIKQTEPTLFAFAEFDSENALHLQDESIEAALLTHVCIEYYPNALIKSLNHLPLYPNQLR